MKNIVHVCKSDKYYTHLQKMLNIVQKKKKKTHLQHFQVVTYKVAFSIWFGQRGQVNR